MPRRATGASRLPGGKIVAFTDDDCIVPSNWLTTLAEAFRRWPEAAGVGGYQEAPEELLQTHVVARAERAMRLQRWGERAGLEQLGGDEVPGLATNNVAFRQDVLLEVGGFDERFPVAAGEDADLKLRIAQRGYRLLYIPLKVAHHREYTLRAQWRMQVRRGIGVYYFEAKHRQAPGLGRVSLRLLKRTALFLLDLRMLPWDVAGIIYLSRVADCVGQLLGRFVKPRHNAARGRS
ncbi:MAG: glycosyltransferase [Ardenticatenia bacterium]|nr:glycosyltransferase [Ardenticatenia bacterium]